MSVVQLYTSELVLIHCYKCHAAFGLNKDHYERARNTGIGFFCTNGHEQFFCDTEIKKLQRERDQLTARNDQLKAEADYQRNRRRQTERQLSATKGVVTRTKNRISKGVCPCCNRYFANVHKHIESQHPSYTKDTP